MEELYFTFQKKEHLKNELEILKQQNQEYRTLIKTLQQKIQLLKNKEENLWLKKRNIQNTRL